MMKLAWRRIWFGSGGRTPWLRRVGVVLFALLVPLPAFYLLLFRFLPVPFTPQMALDAAMLQPVRHRWVAYDDISVHVKRSVLASEDQAFCSHHGFDWDDIEKAMKTHQTHPKRRLRGASTISQQVARTLFLLPVRSWVRKGLEAWLTVLVEALWPKKRIYAAYLNLVDWGHGHYGIEAAARGYFGIAADRLSPTQAARLATILPSPDKWQAARPGPYVVQRSAVIRGRARDIVRDRLDWCVR